MVTKFLIAAEQSSAPLTSLDGVGVWISFPQNNLLEPKSAYLKALLYIKSFEYINEYGSPSRTRLCTQISEYGS